MEIAKITSKGQITVPKSIRERLELKPGSKIVFLDQGRDILVRNATQVSAQAQESNNQAIYYLTRESIPALRQVQEAFKGEAARLELQNEDDVMKLIKAYRRGELE